MTHHDFLLEIFTEELPPKALKKLSQSLQENIESGFRAAELAFDRISAYATPRRLAVIVHALAESQPAQKIERKGPAVAQAFDANGEPTKACLGFLTACGIGIEATCRIKSDKGEWLCYQGEKAGERCIDLAPHIIQKALRQLPIPKPMHWGNHPEAFVRPVHAITLLYGEEIIHTTLLGIESNRVIYGHRFMSKQPITLRVPGEYETQLKKQGFVIADFEERKKTILDKIISLTHEKFGHSASAVINHDLLEEVTALTEWPHVLICQFDYDFLRVPKEALISSMQDHQKCFAIIDNNQKLLPYFVTVSNLDSKDVPQVIHGNERVMRARLSDAKFFYETDLQQPLSARIERLKSVTYQEKLGSIFDKSQRVSSLAQALLNEMGFSKSITVQQTQRATELCKTDLLSQMVGEFPELQGIMGEYYAKHDGEETAVAIALREYYQPRNAQDELPKTALGQLLAVADRMDTITGIFAIKQLPTGDKDPFALRRAALGILKILLEKNSDLDLTTLISLSIAQFSAKTIENSELKENLLAFFYSRLKYLVLDKDITPDVLQSVVKLNITQPSDALSRMQAVQAFKKLEAAEALTNMNKRVNNLLNKNADENLASISIDNNLFEKLIENKLHQAVLEKSETTQALLAEKKYAELLKSLADLKPITDQFFEEVMVIVEDRKLKNNRLTLLTTLRKLFLQVADIAELQ